MEEKENKGNKTVLYVIIALLILVIIGLGVVGFMIFKSNNKSTTTTTTAPTATSSTKIAEILSEQPNKSKFNEYFTEAYLGKLPLGRQVGPPDNIPTKTKIFTSADLFCTAITMKKTIPAGSFASAIYDVASKSYIQAKTVFPQELKQGGTIGCETLAESAGKYEDKIYIDDVLVAVLPFEVK